MNLREQGVPILPPLFQFSPEIALYCAFTTTDQAFTF
jgi:hypothetical protein